MSPISHRQAIISSGLSHPDVNSIRQVIVMMKYSHLDNRSLRSYLTQHVHSFTTIDDQWLRNFRRKVRKFLIDPSLKFSTSDIPSLNYTRNSAAEENIVLDSDLKKQNFRDHLTQILQDSGEGWNVVKILTKNKEKCPGFDFKIWFDSKNKPIGVCWITTDMRNRLKRHGDVLFLDSQKRQFNKHGWVYIGPCIKDHEDRIGTTVESLLVEESIDSYVWVLKSMFDMESKFDKTSIKIIYADEFITENILNLLYIEDTCVLRCDTYHLQSLIWPKYFGSRTWKIIEGGMRRLLLADSPQQYESCFNHVLDLLRGNPHLHKYVENIYKNPKKYSLYELQKIEGNRFINSSSHAEQNHSSNIAHMGKGGTWEIAEHITKLLERERYLSQKKANEDNSWYQGSNTFISDLTSPSDINEDKEARLYLSQAAYNKLWLSAKRKSSCLIQNKNEHGSFVRVIGDESTSSTVFIPNNERCPCTRRIAYMFQCEHEYVVDGKLLLSKYNSTKWMSTHQYVISCSANIAINPIPNPPKNDTFFHETLSCGAESINIDGIECSSNEMDQYIPKQTKKIPMDASYNSIVNQAQELARCAQNDKDIMNAISFSLGRMI